MDVLRKIAALRLLRSRQASVSPQQRSIDKIAIRWLTADINRDYDIMLRLQVLEGATGQQVGVWWGHGRSGLRKAKAELADQNVRPEWFSKDPTGMYKIVSAMIQRSITSYRLTHVEPLDLIHSGLMGIPVKTWEVKNNAKIPYGAGKAGKGKILSGREGPKDVAKGMGGTFLKMVNREWKHVRNQPGLLPTDAEGRQLDAPDSSAEQMDFGEVLSYLVWQEKNSMLSKTVRELMRRTWASSPPMIIWLDMVEQTGRFPEKKTVSEEAGIANAGFISNHWKKRWGMFVDALWKDRMLLDQIKEYFRDHNIEWTGKKPSMADVEEEMTSQAKKPKNKKSSLMTVGIERVATRYLSRTS